MQSDRCEVQVALLWVSPQQEGFVSRESPVSLSVLFLVVYT